VEVSKKSEWEREFARFVGVGLNVATLSCQSEFDGNQEIYAAACLQNTFVERDEASMIKAPPVHILKLLMPKTSNGASAVKFLV